MLAWQRWMSVLLGCLVYASCKSADSIQLVNNGVSKYAIVVPAKPTPVEDKAAKVLQTYIQKISGVSIPIEKELSFRGTPGIYVGATGRTAKFNNKKLPTESFIIGSTADHVFIKGGSGRGVLFGVYHLLEQYWGCRKFVPGTTYIPASKVLSFPANEMNEQIPTLIYRQVYYPASWDKEYADWHKLHSLDDLWALWGHSMHKILPAKQYFKTNPEYFALVGNQRNPAQPEFTNPAVVKITKHYVKNIIAENKDMPYVSVSMNDDVVFSTSPEAQAIDRVESAPSGSLLRFVNSIAQEFPDKTFTTLAYLWAAKPPTLIKPANNVIPFLSNIDAYRTKPLNVEPSARKFREHLQGWAAISKGVFIWDYTTQFTHYLAPFPDWKTLQPNMQFFVQNNVKGVFAQGSGETAADMDEWKCYLQAKLMWNAQQNVDSLLTEFTNYYYGKAAQPILQYWNELASAAAESKRPLDIYGSPVHEFNSYLSPEYIEKYTALLEKALAVVEGNTNYTQRVQKLMLSLEYTVLEQSKLYGAEKHGYLQANAAGTIAPKSNWAARVKAFCEQAKKMGVKELSEGGASTDVYASQWQQILATPYRINKALGGKVALSQEPINEYPTKGNRTLVDGAPGYNDFSFNWLLFNQATVTGTIELPLATTVKGVELHFLHDPRHWIFDPKTVKIWISENGEHYTELPSKTNPRIDLADEDYTVLQNKNIFETNTPTIKTKFIKWEITNHEALPIWRFRENRLPSFALDEVYVY